MFLLTLATLSVFPIPECFACEGPNPWGRNDADYVRNSGVLQVWFLVTSVVSGFISVRRNWAVPLAITAGHILTQPLGGVSREALLGTEGPGLLILGLLAGAVFLIAGYVLRLLLSFARLRWLSPRRQGAMDVD